MKLQCLVIDDEPMARKGLEEYIAEIDFLQLVASCESAASAAAILRRQPVDLLFLDIHMPKITGIDFLKTLHDPPLAIFTTAYPQYALEGYSLDVTDYLVKPITFDRFMKASRKAFELHQLRVRAGRHDEPEENYFFVKCDGKYEKIFFHDVTYIEALQNYAVIHTTGRKFITYITLSGLENRLPKDRFLKVHKSYIVSVPRIGAIEGNEIIIGDSRIAISRNLREEVIGKILGNKLFRR